MKTQKPKTQEYRGYMIEHDLYKNGEYTVQYCGDDVWFATEEEAKLFIDGIAE